MSSNNGANVAGRVVTEQEREQKVNEQLGGFERRKLEAAQRWLVEFGGPTNLRLTEDFGRCRCEIHKRSCVWVPEGGCLQSPVGTHPAVVTAERGQAYRCHATPDVRRADQQFVVNCLLVDKPFWRMRRVPYGVARYGTGTAGFSSFSRGYCILLAFPQKYMMRLARVLGPDALANDYLKFLWVLGFCPAGPLRLVRLGPDFLHVVLDPGGLKGRKFFDALKKEVDDNPNVRVGASFGFTSIPPMIMTAVSVLPAIEKYYQQVKRRNQRNFQLVRYGYWNVDSDSE